MRPLTAGLILRHPALLGEVKQHLTREGVKVGLELAEVPDWAELTQTIGRLAPDIVLIEPQSAGVPLEQAVQALRASPSSPAVLVVHLTADPELILQALRAGAQEYLYPPIGATLAGVLEKTRAAAAMRNGVRMKGRMLGLVSAKGGCGTTTVACHLAVELERVTGQRILLADLDQEAGLVGFMMKAPTRYSLLDAIQNAHRLDASFWKALVSNGRPNIEILTAPPPASDLISQPEQFRTVLRFIRSHYDWVLVDLGRGLNPASYRALDDLDEIFITTTSAVPALYHTRQMIERLFEIGFGRDQANASEAFASNRVRILLNRTARDVDFSPGELGQVIGQPLYATLPYDPAALHAALTEGRLLAEGTVLRKSIAGLASKIAGVAEEKSQRKTWWFR